MKRLVELCLKWRPLVLALVVMVAVVGIRSALDASDRRRARRHERPGADPDQQPGLARPVEVERFITLPGRDRDERPARGRGDPLGLAFGLSVVTVVFEEGTDIYCARASSCSSACRRRASASPRATASPRWGRSRSGLGEIYQFEVRGRARCARRAPRDTETCYTPMELRTILDWFVAYQLRSVPGVVEVNSFGGELKTYQVDSSIPTGCARYGVSARRRVRRRSSATTRNVGGGYIARARRAVPGARRGPDRRAWTTSATSSSAHDARTARRSTSATSARVRVRADDPPGRGDARRPRRGGGRHRHDADGRELARGRRARQGAGSSRSSTTLPAGVTHRHRSTTAPSWSTARSAPWRRTSPRAALLVDRSCCCCCSATSAAG